MRLAVTNLAKVLSDFLLNNIVPKVPNSLQKFGLAFSATYLASNTAMKLDAYLPILQTIGVVSDGFINLESAKVAAERALTTCGNVVNVMGYNADAADVAALYEIAKKYGVN